MKNDLLKNLITTRQNELGELLKVEAFLEEVERLGVPTVYLIVTEMGAVMCGNGATVNFVTDDYDNVAKYVIDYYQEAKRVNVFVSEYDMPGTNGEIVGKLLKTREGFDVSTLRRIEL